MSLYCINCSNFANKNGMKIKREINGKMNHYSFFKKFETIDKEEINDLLKSLNYI